MELGNQELSSVAEVWAYSPVTQWLTPQGDRSKARVDGKSLGRVPVDNQPRRLPESQASIVPVDPRDGTKPISGHAVETLRAFLFISSP